MNGNITEDAYAFAAASDASRKATHLEGRVKELESIIESLQRQIAHLEREIGVFGTGNIHD